MEASTQAKNPTQRQLSLIDGLSVDKLVTELAAATIDTGEITDETVIPSMHQRRYFILDARVMQVKGTSKENAAGDDILTKTVIFKPDSIVELDQMAYERAIKGRS